MNDVAPAPRALTRLWTLLLLPAVAWAVELGVQFSLTDESCASGSRVALAVVAVVCVVLAAAPAPLAWARRRGIRAGSAAADRARFMLGLAAGASLIFTLVAVTTAVPILLLPACRT